MAETEMLMVFCYDVSRDRTRRRVADLLEGELARVQKSVFEARMTRNRAQALARSAWALMDEGDSLRVYAISEAGLRHSLAFGGLGLAEPHDYWLV